MRKKYLNTARPCNAVTPLSLPVFHLFSFKVAWEPAKHDNAICWLYWASQNFTQYLQLSLRTSLNSVLTQWTSQSSFCQFSVCSTKLQPMSTLHTRQCYMKRTLNSGKTFTCWYTILWTFSLLHSERKSIAVCLKGQLRQMFCLWRRFGWHQINFFVFYQRLYSLHFSSQKDSYIASL